MLNRSAATLPDAPALIQQLFWRVRQWEQDLFGPSSERQTPETLSKEPILLSLFPGAAPAATQEVLLPPVAEKTPPRVRRQPAAKVLATVTEPFARLGANFPRPTLCDWIEKGAEWLQPIVRERKRELLAGDYLQVDETPVRGLDPEVKGQCALGYLGGGPSGERCGL